MAATLPWTWSMVSALGVPPCMGAIAPRNLSQSCLRWVLHPARAPIVQHRAAKAPTPTLPASQRADRADGRSERPPRRLRDSADLDRMLGGLPPGSILPSGSGVQAFRRG